MMCQLIASNNEGPPIMPKRGTSNDGPIDCLKYCPKEEGLRDEPKERLRRRLQMMGHRLPQIMPKCGTSNDGPIDCLK